MKRLTYKALQETCFILLSFACVHCIAESGVVSEGENSLTYRQNSGAEVTLPKHPKATVICYSSLVQVWYAAGGTAVAIPSVPTRGALPEKALKLPQLGSHNTMSLEKIMMFHPDLVLLNDKLAGHRQLQRMLTALDIPAACIDYRNYRDFNKVFQLFLRLNGMTVKNNDITEKVDSLCKQTQSLSAPEFASIYIGVGLRIETNLANTACMAAMLGGKNIVPAGHTARMPLSYEYLLLRDPEVIFIVTTSDIVEANKVFHREFAARPEWNSLRAVKNNRVHFLPPALFLYLPGSRFPEAFRYLAELLYPDKEFLE